MKNHPDGDSFENIDEELSSNYEKVIHFKEKSFQGLEDFSEIPDSKALDDFKASTSALSKVLLSKISSMSNVQKFLNGEEYEDFLNLANFISNADETEELCMDLDYLEKIRKQQQLIVKILKKISDLQWEVEKGYCEVKATEEFRHAPEFSKGCSLDSCSQHVNCTCLII